MRPPAGSITTFGNLDSIGTSGDANFKHTRNEADDTSVNKRKQGIIGIAAQCPKRLILDEDGGRCVENPALLRQDSIRAEIALVLRSSGAWKWLIFF
jgi:hypothetical protein